MPATARRQLSDLRGAGKLLFDATAGIVDVVERMHRTIERRPGVIGQPVVEATRGITGFVYRTVRGSTRLIGDGFDTVLSPLEQWSPPVASSPGRDVFVSILNGVYGDHLESTGNPLAIAMEIQSDGEPLVPSETYAHFASAGIDAPAGRLMVLVHGLCMSVQQWAHEGVDRAACLGRELGYTPLHLRYNSGLSIAENGRQFARLLEELVEHWPRPVEELVLVGHSMGGLVARSACHYGETQRHPWRRSLRSVVFLGTPHHGAPLERGGHGFDTLLGLSPYSAPFARLGNARSAGIKDLRAARLTDAGDGFVPLPEDVDCYAIAATLGSRRDLLAERLVGDGLVPLDSALGRHRDRERCLRFAKTHQWVTYRTGHLDLLHQPEVYAQLRGWLQPRDVARA
jgi:Predicted acetyltransferases and hydrolases with the alpha/beta hydrolase fold